jgi:misacylated tRNA(Ala) deacylase
MNLPLPPTERLYLQDGYCFETEAVVLAVREEAVAFDRSPFYPGGGGQPPDEGLFKQSDGEIFEVVSAHMDEAEVVWHFCQTSLPSGLVGQTARLGLDRKRRLALMRYHTVLHIVNTVALQSYDAWITGVQIGTDYSRIDFKVENFSPALCRELEAKVNAVLSETHSIKSYSIPQEEFRHREDLLRTLEVKPPVSHGQVRVVEIEGFDAQACGGTHVHSTDEVGRIAIFRTENKGKINKRLYIQLEQ